MSSKTNTSGKTVINKNSRNVQQTSKSHNIQQKHITPNTPAKELVLVGQCDTVEVTVRREKKGKSQERTSPAASFIPGQKIKEKGPATSNSKVLRSWSHTFGEQNRHLLYREAQSSKHSKNKKMEKNPNIKKQEKDGYCKKCKEKIEEKNAKSSCCMSILVQDRAVQCPENSDKINIFAEFNPVYTLDFLMKDLKDVVDKKDKKTCEIFFQMEQILLRVSESFEKPFSKNLEKKLESSADKLKEYSKQVRAMCETWKAEREKLQSLIQKQKAQLHTVVEILTQQLEATRAEKAKDESELKGQIVNCNEIISNLRMELITQTDLAQKYSDNIQYLTMEKDKLLKLSDCREALIDEYKNTIKELQNENLKQLKTLHEAYMNEGSASSPISAIPPELACSSPTSSSSDRFNKSWHDLSDISSVESDTRQNMILKKEVPIKDSAPLELYSLLDGESSHTLLEQNQVSNEKETLVPNNNKDVPFCRNTNGNDTIARKFLHHSPKKDHNKENNSKTRKFQHKERQNNNVKSSLPHNASRIPENMKFITSIISDTGKQDDMPNRIPVNIPSPLRDYPRPDWSDSSLPSVSAATDLDMIPSNDV